MTPLPLPLTRELVLIGGGHTHALVLRRWGMRPLPGVRLTLVDPGPTAPYTGMLPGHIAGHYPREALTIDLVRLARFAGARLILGKADAIDRERRRVHIAGRGEIAYDVLSLDIGVTSAMPGLPGFDAHAVPAKPLERLADAWNRFLADPGPVAVIGGGVAGTELAMAAAFRLRNLGAEPAVTVLDRSHAAEHMPPYGQRVLRERMARLGVTLREGVGVAEIRPDHVVLAGGEAIPATFTIGAAGPRPYPWLGDTGLDLTDGYVTVGPTLQSVTDPAIFAAGDCAHLSHAPRPKAGAYAVRAAPVLYANLRAALSGGRLRPYRPQQDYMKLVSLGGRAALAERGGWSAAGALLWRLKDRIDRRFIARFKNLPAMRPARLPATVATGVREALGEKPLCGGCGAKVAGGTLAGVLAGLPPVQRRDVLTRPGDDAAVLAFGGARQVLTHDHLRAFTEDPWTLARIAAVHAMGDIWAMGARPQAALASIVLPRMAEPMQAAWLQEITHAAAEAFAAEGAAIVGGHTTLGSELTIGFSVTGLCEAPITLAGARPGDALILTKPLGSGTILAAEMALSARGEWVAAALRAMAESGGRAAEILAGAHAMTDVTGFGLAGHLLAMLDASGVAARLALDRVPLLDGALELASAGTRSTLHPANREAAARMRLPGGPRAELLFDPQTAGGLLAAIPAQAAEARLAELRRAGYRAQIVGEVTSGAPFIEMV